jgi:hypothetical protein
MYFLDKEVFLIGLPLSTPAVRDLYLLRETAGFERERHLDGGIIAPEKEYFGSTKKYCSAYAIQMFQGYIRDYLELKNLFSQ